MQPEHKRSKKRNHDNHDDGGHGMAHDESNWLVSYADMMTLLFGFFVLMYSFSRVDEEKFKIVQKDLVKYFGGKLVDQPGAPEGLKQLTEDIKAAMEEQKRLGTQGATANGQAVADSSEYSVATQGEKLVFTIGSDMLFPSGSSRPSEKAVAVLNKVFEATKGKTVEEIEVEGHTDGDAISTVTFPSNWELSTARASSIVRVFENLGVRPSVLKAVGHSNSRPVMAEKDATGQPIPGAKEKNRRVIISLKVDFSRGDIKKTLTAQGVEIRRPQPTPLVADAGTAAGSEELNSLQERYEAANARLREAQARMKDAQARAKRMKDLEKLSKKTEDMERKLREIEAKATQTLEQSSKAPNTNEAVPATTAPKGP